MANVRMFIAAGLLSILASVAAFSFLITQLIFMCFGRSKRKRKQKAAGKIDGENHGESSGVALSHVRGGAKQKDVELGVECVKIIGHRSRIDDVSIKVDGGGVLKMSRSVPNGKTSYGAGGKNILVSEKAGNGGDRVCGDVGDNYRDNNDGTKSETDIKTNGDSGDVGGYKRVDSNDKVDNNGNQIGSQNGGDRFVSGDDNCADDSAKDDCQNNDTNCHDGGSDNDKRIGDSDVEGKIKLADNDAVDRNDNKDIDKCDTKNHYGDGGKKAYEDIDLDRRNISAHSNNTSTVAEGKDALCINNISGSSSDVTSATANVDGNALNIDGNGRTVAHDGIETKDNFNANQIQCSFKPSNKTREISDVDSHSPNETSRSADGKSLPTSCNHHCACQCNQVDINDSDGQSSICEDHGVVYIQKRRIQLQLNVDITKYQINDEPRNLSEHFSDGVTVENKSLNQTNNTFTSVYGNALCDKVSTGKTGSKHKNTACSIVQQNMIKDQSSIKFYPGGQIVRENMKIIKQSERNDCENFTENTTHFSANNDGLFPGNDCLKSELFFCKNISSSEPKTREITTQVFEEYCSSESSSHSGQNSPTFSNITHTSTQNSSTISCYCSSECEHGREIDCASSDEIMNSYQYNIKTKKSTDLSPSSRSKIYAIEHCINMDCIDCSDNNFGYESEKTLCKNDAENSSIFRRLLSRIAECCISALNAE